MNDLSIVWPEPIDPSGSHSRIDLTRFSAFGRASAEVIAIHGEYEKKGASNSSRRGVSLLIRRPDDTHQPLPFRWTLMLPAPEEVGIYILTVGGWARRGARKNQEPVGPISMTFEVEGGSQNQTPDPTDKAAVTLSLSSIMILSHSQNQNITSQKDDFFAYGSLVTNPLGVVGMTDGSSNTIDPLYVYSDPEVLQYWSAQFPQIPSGTYTLHVADNLNTASDAVSGLTVN